MRHRGPIEQTYTSWIRGVFVPILGVASALLIFAIFALIGSGLYAALLARSKAQLSIRQLFLIPVFGSAALLCPALALNRAGMPVESFATPLVVVLTLAGTIVSLRYRKLLNVSRSFLFVPLFLAAFWLGGRPLFEFGTNWISFANGDMIYYCLGADRILQHGFFAIPDIAQYASDSDISAFSWVELAVANARSGAQTLLALFAGLLHLRTFAAYMPLVMALQLTLLSAGIALVYKADTYRTVAFVMAAALAVSAQNSLGAYYQLIPQIWGGAILAGTIALTGEPFAKVALETVVPWVLLLWGLLVVYPELSPFLFVSLFVLGSLALLRGSFHFATVLKATGVIVGGTLILLNSYFLTTVNTILSAAGNGTGKAIAARESTPVFWYFLVPTGPANLFGILPLATLGDAVTIAAYVVVGFLLLSILLYAAVRQLRCGEPVAVTAVVMIAVAAVLFYRSSDFGLFKIAMYVQPYLFGVLSLALFPLLKRKGVPSL